MNQQLRKLKKIELLEMLLQQEQEIEQLRAENASLKAQVDLQHIRLERSGSIAEAALQLSGIFEAAQQAADLYIKSVQANAELEEQSEHRPEQQPDGARPVRQQGTPLHSRNRNGVGAAENKPKQKK